MDDGNSNIGANPNRVLTVADACAYCSISPQTLWRAHLAGTGPKRIQLTKKRIGYRLADLDAWLEQRTVKTAA